MILTGTEIQAQHARGTIVITPFSAEAVNPNSYNFHLGSTLLVYRDRVLDPHRHNATESITIPDDGLVLEPGRLYLGHTVEVLGSDFYAPTFAARSSVARLGLFINLSASLGDIGYVGQWTLQLYAMHPVRLYPGMPIGQMMWWQPHGLIALYRGKYQGSAGPRASDIHIDYLRQQRQARFPGLGRPVAATEVGGKFATLSRLHRDLPVPPAFVVTVPDFAQALGPDRRDRLAAKFADIHATVGVYAYDDCGEIEALAGGVHADAGLREQLAGRLTDLAAGEDIRFAVRSSAVGEDGEHHSLAGVHRSHLHVEGVDAVIAAVEDCWRSFYSRPAVLARVRIGDFSPEPRMAVVVQRMVAAARAGVAFTRRSPDRVEIEHVPGTGEELMAGVAAPERLTVPQSEPDPPAPWNAVAELAFGARAQLTHEVDVEWALDHTGQAWLLQARPITAALNPAASCPHPVGLTTPLYTSEPTNHTLHPGAVGTIVASYRRKRGPAYTLAGQHGAAVLPGWLVNVNGHGLADPTTATALGAVFDAGPARESVLDLGGGIRQQIVPKRDVVETLSRLLATSEDSDTVHAVVIRDFVRGTLGLIATYAGPDLLLEASPDGLLAMNRGTATTARRITIAGPDTGAPTSAGDIEPLDPTHLPTIRQVTAALKAAYGDLTVEWTLADGQLYFVDYSTAHAGPDTLGGSDRVISHGQGTGPLLTLRSHDDDQLARLSLGAAISVTTGTGDGYDWAARLIREATGLPRPPIIVARRPYAALSVLIGHVAGFLFEDGATLCHLGILLREAGVPALIAASVPAAGTATIDGPTLTYTDDA